MRTEEEQVPLVNEEPQTQSKEVMEASQPSFTRWTQFIAFLNKPLGIWLLTSVLISGATWMYSLVATSVQKCHENAIARERLNEQVGIRLEVALDSLKKAVTPDDYKRVLQILLEDTAELRLSPDFKDRSTFSIVWEAARRQQNSEEDRKRFQVDEHTKTALLLLVELSNIQTKLQKMQIGDADLVQFETEIKDKLLRLEHL